MEQAQFEFTLGVLDIIQRLSTCHMSTNYISAEEICAARELLKPYLELLSKKQCQWLNEVFDEEEWVACERGLDENKLSRTIQRNPWTTKAKDIPTIRTIQSIC
jgi:hypothetical protein